MNKKRLSVVMAGAMLASSVAPVLAAETNNNVEVSAAQKGELINSLTGKIWAADRFSATDKKMPKWSVYGIQINDKAPIGFVESVKGTGSETKLQAAIKAALKDIRVGDTVKLVDLGTEKRGEELFSQYVSTKYTESEITNPIGEANSIADQVEALKGDKQFNLIVDVANSGQSKDSKSYILKFQKNYVDYLKNTSTTEEHRPYGVVEELKLDTNSERLDLRHYYNSVAHSTTGSFDGTNPVNYDSFFGFVKVSKDLDIPETVVESTEILAGGDTYNTKDLYDGLFLTTKGYELLNKAKEVEAILLNSGVANNATTTKLEKVVIVSKSVSAKDGKYAAAIKIANPAKVADKVKNKTEWTPDLDKDYDAYYITGDSEPELKTLVKWLNEVNPKVDKIEGEDRYTTAVKIAKEAKLVGRKAGEGVKTKDIVLVNGKALVDGLAAAPLAGKLSAKGTDAPILLTKTDELPRATQRYLRELIDVENNKNITVHIVGGESVVSNNVKKQLRALGLNVERYAGEDREETSMAVAKEIGFDNGAFVVGARGEADAMSISGYAASRIAPVVVSGFDGLSEDTIDELDGAIVNVIGGEAVVSKADFEEVEAVAETTNRVYGEDRKATNAAVINTFYTNRFREADSVIVAKDGMGAKDELIDALAAANLASKQHAPIVLGTKSLSKEQIAAIVSNAKTADKVYQIGGGIERNVVKVVAEALKMVNK